MTNILKPVQAELDAQSDRRVDDWIAPSPGSSSGLPDARADEIDIRDIAHVVSMLPLRRA